MNTWQLQDAKARLSELVQKALHQGPQEITLRGEPAVIVISKSSFEHMMGESQLSLVEFIQDSPLKNTNLKIKRNKSLARDINLSED